MKYYATYDLPMPTDIYQFETAEARDRWVTFNDAFSVAFNVTADDCMFDRKIIDSIVAETLISNCRFKQKTPDAVIYCLSCGRKRCNYCGRVIQDSESTIELDGVFMPYGSKHDGNELCLTICADCADELVNACAISPIIEMLNIV